MNYDETRIKIKKNPDFIFHPLQIISNGQLPLNDSEVKQNMLKDFTGNNISDSEQERNSSSNDKNFPNNFNLSLNEQDNQKCKLNSQNFNINLSNSNSKNIITIEKNHTNLTQVSTALGINSDVEEGELLESSEKSKNFTNEGNDLNGNTYKNTNGSVSLSKSNESQSNYTEKNINNISNFDNRNSTYAPSRIDRSIISQDDKSPESIENFNNINALNNSNINSGLKNNIIGNNINQNTNSNHSTNIHNGNNRNNNINQKVIHNNNNFNNKKANNNLPNVTYNKNNLKLQNSNVSVNNNSFNNNINNFKNCNEGQQNMINNYAQYMQYIQNFHNNINNPNGINNIANINSHNNNNIPSNTLPQIGSFPSNNPSTSNIINQNTNNYNHNFNNNSNNGMNIFNMSNPINHNILLSNNSNNFNFNQVNPNNQNHSIEKKLDSIKDNKEQEIREFKIFFNENPLNIQLTGKIQKDSKITSFLVYQMVTLDIFLQVFGSRLNFLSFNQLIVHLTFNVDKNCPHAPTRKFIYELTEKNYFGLIKREKSYYIIFSSLNKEMRNTLESNILPVFILNDYQKILQLEKMSGSSNNLKEIDKKIEIVNEIQQQPSQTELIRLKSEKEKLEKSIEELKRKLEIERNNNHETKSEFQKYTKRAKAELDIEKTKCSEYLGKAKFFENKAKDFETKYKTVNEKIKSIELEKIFMRNKSQNEVAIKNKITSLNLKNDKSIQNKENINSLNVQTNMSSTNNSNNNFSYNSQIKNIKKCSNFLFKPISKLAFVDGKIIMIDEKKVKLDYDSKLENIEIELSDENESLNTPSKQDFYEKILDKANFPREDSYSEDLKSNYNINGLNKNNLDNNISTIGGNFIEEIGQISYKQNDETLQNKINELREKLDAHLCVICTENNRDCLFEECGHLTCCYNCISNEMNRTDVKNYQRVLKLSSKINTFKFKFDFKCPVCQFRNKAFMKVILP